MKVDASDHVLGRLSTHLVEALKDGEEVQVFNADRVIVKGDPEDIIDRYQKKYERGSKEHGPKYPQQADRIVRRTVRGMLPSGSQGRDLYSNLRVYEGEPDGDAEQFEDAKVTSLRGGNFLRMGEISRNIG